MNHTPPTRRISWPATLAAVAGVTFTAAGVLLPVPAWAAPVMAYGELTIQLEAVAELGGSSTEIVLPPVRFPGGSPTRAEVFVTPGVVGGPSWSWGGFAYGTPTNHPEQAFASAQMDGRGFADMGVSGRSEGSPTENGWGYLRSGIFAQQRVTNTGDAGRVNLDYTIPLIEIAQYGNRWDGTVAAISANLQISRYNSGGDFVEDLVGFDYIMNFHYVKPFDDYAIQTYPISADLLRDSRGLVDVERNGCSVRGPCTGMAIEPFSVSRTLGELAAGDYLQYSYFMAASMITGREGGGHALYGDPLAFSGGGGRNFFEFSAADAATGAVPEPPSWALLGLGGALLAWRRQRGAAAQAAGIPSMATAGRRMSSNLRLRQ